MRRAIAVGMLVLASAASAGPVDDVLAADRAFAALAKAKGARAAFTEYADPQAIMFLSGVGPVKGRDAEVGPGGCGGRGKRRPCVQLGLVRVDAGRWRAARWQACGDGLLRLDL